MFERSRMSITLLQHRQSLIWVFIRLRDRNVTMELQEHSNRMSILILFPQTRIDRPTYNCGPPLMLVLWCMSFHVMELLRPVVADVPIVKMSLLWKAVWSSLSTFSPSSQAGRKAVLDVLQYFSPGFRCSGWRDVARKRNINQSTVSMKPFSTVARKNSQEGRDIKRNQTQNRRWVFSSGCRPNHVISNNWLVVVRWILLLIIRAPWRITLHLRW